MRVGFIHGVMNTDNTAISGETIDFGPCAMMGTYNLQAVFSSIDQQGRYAFGNQPHIAQWNMARFAECLLMLMDRDINDKAMQPTVEAMVQDFAKRFQAAYTAMMSHKLGLLQYQEGDDHLIEALVKLLQDKQLDYTITFDQLLLSFDNENIRQQCHKSLGTMRHSEEGSSGWYQQWHARIQHQDIEATKILMQKNNPVVIPQKSYCRSITRGFRA